MSLALVNSIGGGLTGGRFQTNVRALAHLNPRGLVVFKSQLAHRAVSTIGSWILLSLRIHSELNSLEPDVVAIGSIETELHQDVPILYL